MVIYKASSVYITPLTSLMIVNLFKLCMKKQIILLMRDINHLS